MRTITVNGLAFENLGDDKFIIYGTKGDDVRNLELSILAIINGIRSHDKSFAPDQDAVVTIKYTKDWRYTVLISSGYCGGNFGASSVYDVTERDILKYVREQEDADDKVFIDVSLSWDGGNIKKYPQYLDTSRWLMTNYFLKSMEILKRAGKVFGFTVLSNAVVAYISYWFTGTPWYIVNAVLNTNNAGPIVKEGGEEVPLPYSPRRDEF